MKYEPFLCGQRAMVPVQMETKMTKIETTLTEGQVRKAEALFAATYETTIAKAKTFQVVADEFPAEALVALMQYGIGRKFNDKVGGGDKTAATKVELATKMLADWKEGKIGRQAAAGVTDEIKVRRQLIAQAIRAAGKGDDIKDLDAAALAEKCDAVFDAQSDAGRAAIMVKVAEEIERRKAKPVLTITL